MRNSALVNLDVEKIIYIIFIIISIMGIIGTNYEEKFLLTKDTTYHKKGSTIFKITITIALLIYLYYLKRNYEIFNEANEKDKNMIRIRLFGSIFFVVGALCLVYFRFKDTTFVEPPEI